MKIAIMQPYIFPYIGYFQLINSVDTFVFYDDVNFIKKGWINRNQILVNNVAHLFTIPLLDISQNKLIKEINLGYDEKWVNRFFSTIKQNYKKAPYFDETFQLITATFDSQCKSIADLAINSIKTTSNYLELSTVFEISSKNYSLTKGMEKADRLIEISKQSGVETYINPIGGEKLYNKNYFKRRNIDLFFIKNNITPYNQFNSSFVPGLSIIDVLMFNSKEKVLQFLNDYELV